MNRILTLLVALAFLALLAFGVVVLTSGGPPAQLQPASTDQPVSQPAQPQEGADTTPTAVAAASEAEPEMRPQTPEAAARFEAWAKPLRDDGLTVTAGRVAESGDTLSVSGLVIVGPPESPGWRWTTERASLYDRELFHLQAAGATEFVVITAPGQEVSWSGRADAIGIAVKRDERDVLGRSVIVRVNGLALSRQEDIAPFMLGDGQLRIILKAGTGILTPGTDLVLRLTDLSLPSAADSALGTKLKSFATEFAIDRPITSYSLTQMVDFFTRPGLVNVNLGTIAIDWGPLHFTGGGAFGFGPGGVPRGRFEVMITDPLVLLDALGAAGAASGATLAEHYAAILLELGKNHGAAVPMGIVIRNGTIALEGQASDVPIGTAPRFATGG